MKTKLLSLIPSIILLGCNNSTQTKIVTPNQDVPIQHIYSEIQQYEIKWNQMFEVERADYYIYFYSLTCSHCEDLKNFIIETAQKREDIFFVKSSSKDQLSNDSKMSIGAGNPGEIWILGYPSLIKIENKICIKNLAGTSQILSELK